MKTNGLTATQVKHMKPSENRVEIPAWPPKGLYLVVHPSGKKTWAFRYRWKGATRKLTLEKPYPDLTLAQARAEAEAALVSLDQGVDPAADKAAEEAKPDTVKTVVKEFLRRKVKGTKTQVEVERILRKEVVLRWGERKIVEIEKADVLRLVDKINDRPAPVMANRVLSVLKRLFNWCLERGLLEVSPAALIKTPNKEKTRDRTLSDEELSEIWTATKALGYPLTPYYRLLILTAQRRSEVARIEWPDIDLEKDLWTLPSHKTKPGRVHDVPLSTVALDLLNDLPRFDRGEFVFSSTSGRKAINGFSKAKAAIDAKIAERRKKGKKEPLADWRLHDLRRTAATRMAESGVDPHVLSAILNHSPGTSQGVTSIYNRFRYTEQRHQALESWAHYVLNLTDKSDTKDKIRIA